MKIIGITGGIGSGKTKVMEYLQETQGAVICRTDEVGRKLQRKGTSCFQKIVETFGEEVLNTKGSLDREKLAEIVFSQEEKRERLNSIVHPAVKEEVLKKIEKERKKGTEIFLLESALLIEDSYEQICDELWYIYVESSIRRKRLVYTRGYTEEKIEKIMAAQLPKQSFLDHCNRVVDNSGSFAETIQQLEQIMKDLTERQTKS
ncbi:dephospho-CoA kinase [Suipraeoptans intestinalis]|uniref:Dephospho-CoA kinase n=1 Tax=Suipraeoptans intestinalis TaxID=2606628 RepID=A0A6N7V451_9FIRM|nr:dephospho-CoA kinase [Suipraeoptans intestinalis]MDD7771078.1 dephospho-CoA kinase [Suipraeoptans intestinalis]MDY3122058.1 dephospho-CoA kinase [Suipraeoptans intestinalis]MSR94900.1 dephospho-CoA kinase [Suipraeoptans intestinalis]